MTEARTRMVVVKMERDEIEGPRDNLDIRVRKRGSAKGFVPPTHFIFS